MTALFGRQLKHPTLTLLGLLWILSAISLRAKDANDWRKPVSADYLRRSLPGHCLDYGTPLPASFGPLCFLDETNATSRQDFGTAFYRWRAEENGVFLHQVAENDQFGKLLMEIWFLNGKAGAVYTSGSNLSDKTTRVKLIAFQR